MGQLLKKKLPQKLKHNSEISQMKSFQRFNKMKIFTKNLTPEDKSTLESDFLFF